MRTLLLAGLLSGALAPRPDDESVRQALEQVRTQRDAVAPAVLEGLANERSRAALDALVEAAHLFHTPSSLQLAYGLLARFRGAPELEERALAVLVEDALGAHRQRWLPATEGLVEFGDPAVDALRRVFERTDDPGIRATALGPLLPGLRIAGDVDGLDDILAYWRQPESGSYEAAVRTLAGFRDDAHLRRFERVLNDPSAASELRTLVIDALTWMPTEGADGVLVRALDGSDDNLRIGVIRALEERGTRGHERLLERLTDSGPSAVRAAAWIALAGRVPEDSRYQRRLSLLTKHTDSLLRASAATVLGRVRFDDATALLVRLLDDDEWRVRDAALDACLERRTIELVPALIARLDVEAQGRRDRVRDTLIGLTAQDHGAASPRWRAWWEAEGHARPLATPADVDAYLAARPAREPGDGRSSVQFFGIPITSDRVAFVIDSSGSMEAATGTGGRTRIEVAKARLVQVLERLDPSARFNIFWFASGTSAWRGRLALRTASSLRAARQFVEERRSGGGTALYDGLMAAWRDRDVEAIYLLTDGAPSAGRVVEHDAILADVRARFGRRPVTVHCIAVGTESALMEAIAGITGGVYQVVD